MTVDIENALRRANHPGSRNQIADPQPVTIEQGEKHKYAAPDDSGERNPGVDAAAPGEDKAQRQKHLQFAHDISREYRVGRERPTAPRRHPDAEDTLAGCGRAWRQLEYHEIKISEDKRAEKPDHTDKFARARAGK